MPVGDAPRGFWAAAREEPVAHRRDRRRQGRAWTAGELLAGANRLVHALRARGWSRATWWRLLTRNAAELLVTAARGLPGRLAVRAAQHPPDRGRGGVHPRRLRRRGAGRRRRVRRRRRARRRTTAGVPAGGRIAVGGDIPGFTSLDGRARRPARHRRPTDRVAGQFMQYTSGTTGRPKAVQRDLPHVRPRDVGRGCTAPT